MRDLRRNNIQFNEEANSFKQRSSRELSIKSDSFGYLRKFKNVLRTPVFFNELFLRFWQLKVQYVFCELHSFKIVTVLKGI